MKPSEKKPAAKKLELKRDSLRKLSAEALTGVNGATPNQCANHTGHCY